MKLSPAIKRIGAAVLAAAILTAIAAFGILDQPDYTVSDFVYQSSAATDGEIVVIGMDQRAVDALGPMPWPRSVIADAIEYLNSDPARKPAAIGIDVLFVGDSAVPEDDAALVEAAKIFNSIPTQEMAVREDSTPTREIAPGSGVSFDPKQLIADAKEMAGRDKELTKYIEKVEKTIGKAKRGSVGGPVIKTSMVLTLSTDQYLVKFEGGRKATVIVEGTDVSDIDLYIYDENENLITYDDDATSECAVSFNPRWTGYFIIAIVNNGLIPNPYLLCTN